MRMNMWRQPMNTDRQALVLAQWLSPAYPIGAFAYSHGLEAAIHQGAVRTAGELEDWLSDILVHGSGRNDCILLRAAHGCATLEDLNAVDMEAQANAASGERLLEMRLQGAAFCKTTSAICGRSIPDLTLPVAVGYASGQMNLSVSLTAVMYLQAFVSNLVSAAMRLLPIGQTESQIMVARLTPLCETVAYQTEGTGLDALQSSAFLSDVAAMRHETLEPRIFRS